MSIDTRLFLYINCLVGRNCWWDAFHSYGARFGLPVATGLYFFSGLQCAVGTIERTHFVLISSAVWITAWIVNQVIGLIVGRPRPFVNHPQVRRLITTLSSWKSFPSDHAMSAWLFIFLPEALGFTMMPGITIVLIVFAVWISWSRVFAGVHYIGDIFGGAAVAALMACGANFIFLA